MQTEVKRQRRRYIDWLEVRALRAQERAAGELNRLSLLSQDRIATPREAHHLDKARNQLRELSSRLYLIRIEQANLTSR